MICVLQSADFSGTVYYVHTLAQSPFLFLMVFGVNLIPFFFFFRWEEGHWSRTFDLFDHLLDHFRRNDKGECFGDGSCAKRNEECEFGARERVHSSPISADNDDVTSVSVHVLSHRAHDTKRFRATL